MKVVYELLMPQKPFTFNGANCVIDLDGVIWRGNEAIPGSADAVATMQRSCGRVAFVTNNSSLTVDEYVMKLHAHGIVAEPDDVITSAQAVVTLLAPRDRVLAFPAAGLIECLQNSDITVVSFQEAATAELDAVIVAGGQESFNFDLLTSATRAVRAGARLLAVNDDATFPTPDGLVPGGGAVLALVSTASNTQPTVAGKPYDAMVNVVASRLRQVDLVIGDRPSTDGLLAQRLNAQFGLVLSGVTSEPDGIDPPSQLLGKDLSDLVAGVLAQSSI